MFQNLCDMCIYRRIVVSNKGSRFLLCEKSKSDGRFPKYPPQPLLKCEGFVQGDEGGEGAESSD